MSPSGQQVEQGRLPRSVGPHDAQAFAPVQDEIDPGEHQWPLAVAVSDPGALDHLVAEARCVTRTLQLGRSHGRHRGTLKQSFGRVDPGLGLARPRLRTAPEPGQLTPGQVPSGRLRCGGVVLTFGFRLEIRPVAAFVHVGPPAVELEHAGRDAVEQMAVVGHQDQAAPEGEQALLEPRHGAQIEMVGGFVEDQELGGMGQHPGQCHPFGLPARERPDVVVDGRGHAQTVQRRLGLPPLADGAAHGAGRELGRLREKAHPGTPSPENLALVGKIGAGDDPQQG